MTTQTTMSLSQRVIVQVTRSLHTGGCYKGPSIVLVKKDASLRFCMDYTKMHAVTMKDNMTLGVEYNGINGVEVVDGVEEHISAVVGTDIEGMMSIGIVGAQNERSRISD